MQKHKESIINDSLYCFIGEIRTDSAMILERIKVTYGFIADVYTMEEIEKIFNITVLLLCFYGLSFAFQREKKISF